MRNLARWGLRQMEASRLFRSKPLLGPLLRLVGRYLTAPTPEAGEAAVRALAMSRFADFPILFRDRHDLEYLLYPGQNAEIYIANQGNYEAGETTFCLQHIQPGMTLFDIGANIGLYALLFAKCAGPAGQVHAFEPEPRNFRRLVTNLAINRFENVTANEMAVYSQSQPVTLNVYPDALHALHSLGRASDAVEPESRRTVQATSLDDYCKSRGIERIDYLKIDVEGAECDVLQGASSLLARQAVGTIQFEALPQANDVFRLLQTHGFRCHPIGADGNLLPEASATREGYANYAAVRG